MGSQDYIQISGLTRGVATISKTGNTGVEQVES